MNVKPLEIEPGRSYACYFTVRNIPLDRYGRPGGLYSMSDLPIERTGDYEGFGVIVTRDTEQELFEIEDTELKRRWVVPWADTRDIDVAEYAD